MTCGFVSLWLEPCHVTTHGCMVTSQVGVLGRSVSVTQQAGCHCTDYQIKLVGLVPCPVFLDWNAFFLKLSMVPIALKQLNLLFMKTKAFHDLGLSTFCLHQLILRLAHKTALLNNLLFSLHARLFHPMQFLLPQSPP